MGGLACESSYLYERDGCLPLERASCPTVGIWVCLYYKSCLAAYLNGSGNISNVENLIPLYERLAVCNTGQGVGQTEVGNMLRLSSFFTNIGSKDSPNKGPLEYREEAGHHLDLASACQPQSHSNLIEVMEEESTVDAYFTASRVASAENCVAANTLLMSC